ncbi:hypothetical protein DSO57_1037335 [Entomophthora muscae]|uniref:Uncharacterized protein n=1 Tax=Entomophthora muscae TaxID=34485 RepID=A0ACC2RQ20_9FUNG|nr:hypothetical protein DSO57_1037335 [Entomophthora muscae]
MFGRSHVSNCHLLDNFPLDLGPANVLFEHDQAKYAFSSGSEYSLLDCLLNHGKFYLFEQCLTHILSSLGPRHPVADNNSGLVGLAFLNLSQRLMSKYLSCVDLPLNS